MLVINNIWAKGRHNTLFGPTSFEVEPGEVIIIQADSQLERTALSLTLTGRMKPSGGSISRTEGKHSVKKEIRRKQLRKRSELIDSPDVNEPENFMRVRDYVSEMLSYQLSAFSRPRSKQWLEENGLEELDNLWIEQVSGEQNIRLMCALARSYDKADLLVFDTPSRHLNHTYMWLPYLQELAEDPEHPRIVIAVVPHISSKWTGKRAVVGNAHEEFDEASTRHSPVMWHEVVEDSSENQLSSTEPQSLNGSVASDETLHEHHLPVLTEAENYSADTEGTK